MRFGRNAFRNLGYYTGEYIAPSAKMVLSGHFCGMNDNEVSSIVNQLSENGIIEPKQGVPPDSKDYRDYII